MTDPTQIQLSLDLEELYTKFDFISGSVETREVTYIDEYKNKQEAVFSFSSEKVTKENFLCCFWDRELISERVIKCPISKIYKNKVNTYISSINGNEYTIQDSLNVSDFYYTTDGNFCSPECCMAFIKSNENDTLYESSETLLSELLGYRPDYAPSWRLLKKYGGTLSIEEFRASFKNKNYIFEGIATHPILFVYKRAWHL